MGLFPDWISGVLNAVTAVGKAVAAVMNFAQRQQDKQAGIDAQVAQDQNKAAQINAAEAKAVTEASDAVDSLKQGKF